MTFLTAIAGAARRLRNTNTALAVPVDPVADTKYIKSVALTEQTPDPLKTMQHTDHFAPILRSPLAAATSVSAADSLDTIYASAAVQSAAGYASAKHQRLMAMRAHLGEIHLAIAAIGGDPASITPEAVIETLRRRADQLDDEIDDWRDDHAAHVAASRARMKRHEPLRKAVSMHLAALTGERDHLLRADESAKRATGMGLPSRYATLRNAGLTEAQIAATEPDAASPEEAAAKRRQRIAEIAPMVKACRAFGQSPGFDAALVAGLSPEINSAILARDGALPTGVA